MDARDKDGLTPLHDACTLGKVEVVEYLISQGASVDAVDKVRFFFSLLLFLTSEF